MSELLATLPPLARAAVPAHSTRFDAALVLWEEDLPGGCHWSGVLRRGSTLRLVDVEGRANVSALFHNHERPAERYNMPDTLKAQHTAHLAAGCVCYSDMGRVLCSIAEDTCGWHDPLCGSLDAATMQSKYGSADYQTHRNAMHRAGREGLLVELAKWGLGRGDMATPLNLFSKAVADAEGRLRFEAGHRRAGQHVDLRFEMDVLVALSAAPHPLDPSPRYAPGPVKLLAWHSGTAGADDPCRLRCPENERGFVNTERYFLR